MIRHTISVPQVVLELSSVVGCGEVEHHGSPSKSMAGAFNHPLLGAVDGVGVSAARQANHDVMFQDTAAT